MTRKFLLIGFGATLLAMSAIADADPVLFDWGFNVDGTTYCDLGPCDNDGVAPGTIPGIDVSGFDFGTGLGSIGFTISGAGAHSLVSFFDHEIDVLANTWFNEFGATGGTAAAGQSWEIDEPGYVFGDIFDNFLSNTLDNSNGVPSGADDDVSVAMGWNFVLAADQTATISFLIGESAPVGFFLNHTDPDSVNAIYLSSALDVMGGGTQIPEPGTLWLLGAGLLGLGISRRRNLT